MICFSVGEENGFLVSQLIGEGVAAAGGAATGQLVFSSEQALLCAARGERCILCRRDASTEDIEGMQVSCLVIEYVHMFYCLCRPPLVC
jgi:hypothetical protein